MRYLSSAAILGAFVVSACNPDILNTKPEVRGLEGAAPVQTLTNPVDGTEAVLRPGGQLVVRLASNPTTGYYWSVVEPGDRRIADMVSETYIADPAPEDVVGNGGVQVFVFEGAVPGKMTMTLSYQRDENDVADRLNLKIKTLE